MPDSNQIKYELTFHDFFKTLPTSVEAIKEGHSHLSFKVVCNNKQYFAKYIGDRCADNELAVLKKVSGDISPTLRYYDSKWFISDFLDYPTLTSLLNTKPSLCKKINSLAIKAMVDFHRYNANIPAINFADLFIQAPFITANTFAFIQSFIAPILASKNTRELVLCHGDLNFSNLLITDKTKNYFLIDYECSGYAEREFDIAMMMAINHFTYPQLPDVISEYTASYKLIRKLNSTTQKILNKNVYNKIVCADKVTRYYIFSLYINTLWYFTKYKESGSDYLLNRGEEQKKLLIESIEAIKKGN